MRRLAAQAGVRRRFAPHQLRHGHAVELAREGVPVNIIQRQLGHSDLGTTSTYLQGIDPSDRQRRSLPPTTDDAGQRGARPMSDRAPRSSGRGARGSCPLLVADRRRRAPPCTTARAAERRSDLTT
ncbi:MAG: tyrosine-type recombinase/integrase [Solirubrobacteraceae bacterium]